VKKRRKGGKRRLDEVTPYVATLMRAMHLDHWKIVVNEMKRGKDADVERDGETIAVITPLETRHVATLDLYPPFFRQRTPELRRHALVHELAHLLLTDLQFAHLAGQGSVDDRDWQHLHRQFTVGLERAVDDVAAILAPFLPLPPGEASKEVVP
jgi:hypothetical protein